MLDYTEYAAAAQKLRPDIIVGLGDVLFGHNPGVKRADRMGDRTLAWLKELIGAMKNDESGTPHTALFAPILPIEVEQQSYYLDALRDDLVNDLAGIALYDPASVDAIPENLRQLPRLHLGDVGSPHKLLDAIALGIDIFTIPFINQTTDAGIALDFSFPISEDLHGQSQIPLGKDMWSTAFATSLEPLRPGCTCYTCKHHHCAFVQHLLNAKEMLAWVLLQLHNHHMVNNFFSGVRHSLAQSSFEEDRRDFGSCYAAELPAKTGQGPR